MSKSIPVTDGTNVIYTIELKKDFGDLCKELTLSSFLTLLFHFVNYSLSKPIISMQIITLSIRKSREIFM